MLKSIWGPLSTPESLPSQIQPPSETPSWYLPAPQGGHSTRGPGPWPGRTPRPAGHSSHSEKFKGEVPVERNRPSCHIEEKRHSTVFSTSSQHVRSSLLIHRPAPTSGKLPDAQPPNHLYSDQHLPTIRTISWQGKHLVGRLPRGPAQLPGGQPPRTWVVGPVYSPQILPFAQLI